MNRTKERAHSEVLSSSTVTKRPLLFLSISLGFLAAIPFVACGTQNFSNSSQVDAGASSDAIGSDATAAGASDPCRDGAAPHKLCDDFDQPTISTIWKVFGSCPIPRLDSSESVSPPQSLRTGNDEAGVPPPDCATFYATFGQTPTMVHCEADVKLDQLATATFDFFAINTTFPADITYHQVALNFSGSAGAPEPVSLGEEVSFSDAGGSYNGTGFATGVTPFAGWFHVVLVVDYVSRMATASVAGKPQSAPLRFVPDGGRPNSEVIFRPGIGGIDGDGGVAIAHYDNVFCDVN
jgi:hypothetical protein